MSRAPGAEPESGLAAAWRGIVARRKREAPDEMRDRIGTPANCLTLLRAVLSAAVLTLAILEQRPVLLPVGLALSMSLDVLDGYVARCRREETILGAQLDGLADRLTAALVLAAAVYLDPSAGTALAAAAVWIQYGVVEQLLNVQFLRFGLWSPDHFHLESERVWRLNWSALAKAVSGLPIVLMAIGVTWPALAISLLLIATRIPCYSWIAKAAHRLPEQRPRRGRSEGGVEPHLGAVDARADLDPVAELVGDPEPAAV